MTEYLRGVVKFEPFKFCMATTTTETLLNIVPESFKVMFRRMSSWGERRRVEIVVVTDGF